MSEHINKLKEAIRSAEFKIEKASKAARVKLIEDFSGFCNQLSAHFARKGDFNQSKIYQSKSEVYDDDEEMESINER